MRPAAVLALIALGAAPAPVALRDAMLDAHNRARAQVGTPPLAWSDALAADARAYAAELARSGAFAHSPLLHDLRQGENLWMGTAGRYGYSEMADAWARERRDFVNRPMPDASRSGGAIGHYTQMVWWSTTHVGCAVAGNGARDYLVCRYSPPGNWIGQSAYPAPPPAPPPKRPRPRG